MKISLYSCISSVILGSFFLSVICLIRKKICFTKRHEVSLFLFLYILGVSRLAIPIDFSFTNGIEFRGTYSGIIKFLFIEKIYLPLYNITIGSAILGILCIVSVFKLLKLIVSYCKEYQYWNMNSFYNPEQLAEVNDLIKEKEINVPNCSVIVCPEIAMPLVTGIHNKYIILPETEYTVQELFYILSHEYMHINRGDLYKKLLIESFCTFFWWIPFSYFMSSDLEQFLEIKCDDSVLKSCSVEDKVSYMNALIDSLKRTAAQKSVYMSKKSLSFALQEKPNLMLERFRLIANCNHENRKPTDYVIMAAGIALLTISYLFVPMPSYEPVNSDVGSEGLLISPDNSYLLKKDGHYYLITQNYETIEISEEHAKNMIEDGLPIKEEKDEKN